ncbi:alpha/beta fold hydrolase [Pseudonocardia sp.]|uniref:alpha/beta fold hydrolase n=1 Tax=Pseudonocardia sp. TaxID=60912 RepID=UPI003D11580E
MGEPAGAVLVHGLWHDGGCWDAVRTALDERGITSTAAELPLTGLEADTAATRAAIDAVGGPVVLLGHSYGGAVVTGAGTHPLVRELVYVAAFQLDEGESVSRAVPGEEFPPTRLGDALRIDGAQVALDPALVGELLYQDVAPEIAARAAQHLRPVDRSVFRGVPAQIAWRTVESTYVVCAQDRAVHPELQRAMARRATRTVEWECGHFPLLSRPDELADLVAARARAAA